MLQQFNFLTLFTCLIVLQKTCAKGLEASLQAKWHGTPIIHEAAEFLADESPALFWDFASRWPPSNLATAAAQEHSSTIDDLCWASIIDSASVNLSPRMGQVLHMSLSLRQYSPRLEAIRQLANTSEGLAHNARCHLTVGDESLSVTSDDPATMNIITAALTRQKKAASKLPSSLYAFDHIFPSHLDHASASQRIPVVLYGALGDPCAKKLDPVLREMAQQNDDMVFVWRLVSPSDHRQYVEDGSLPCAHLGASDRVTLPGYGVELAIKNMEYNAQDDSKKSKESSASPSPVESSAPNTVPSNSGSSTTNNSDHKTAAAAAGTHADNGKNNELIAGFDFTALSESDSVDAHALDMKQLGLVTADRIASADDPLSMLTDLSQNFPLLAKSLSEFDASETMRHAATGLEHRLMAGSSYFLLNGMLYDTSEFNLFNFVNVLRREVKLLDALALSGFDPEHSRQAAFLRGAVEHTGPTRIALHPSADQGTDRQRVAWANNVERDAVYRRLPASLSSMLQPSFMGQMPSVRRNLFTALFMFDPWSKQGIDAGMTVHMLVKNGWPIRLGMMPVIGGHESQDEDELPSSLSENGSKEGMHRAFALVATHHGGHAAAEFLALIAQSMHQIDDFDVLSNDAFLDKYGKTALWGVAENVLRGRWTSWSSNKDAPRSDNDTDNDEYDVDEEENDADDEAARVDVDAALKWITKADRTALTDDDNDDALHSLSIFDAAESFLKESTLLAHRVGLASTALSHGMLVLNGIVSVLDSTSSWKSLVIQQWQEEIGSMQHAIYHGLLRDDSIDLLQDILIAHKAAPRYNPRALVVPQQGIAAILESASSSTDLIDDNADDGSAAMVLSSSAPRQVNLLGKGSIAPLPLISSSIAALKTTRLLRYFTSHSQTDAVDDADDAAPATTPCMITHWVVVDVVSSNGRRLLANAMQYIASAAAHENTASAAGAASRIGILLNPQKSTAASAAEGGGGPSALLDLTPIEEFVAALSSGSIIPTASMADIVDITANLAMLDDTAAQHTESSSSSSSSSNGIGSSVPIKHASTGHVTFDEITRHLLPDTTTAFLNNDTIEAILLPLRPQIHGMVSNTTTALLRDVLDIKPGSNAVVTNGRILVSRFENDITPEDFVLLDINAVRNQHANSMLEDVVTKLELNQRDGSDAAMLASNVLTVYQSSDASDTGSLTSLLHEYYDSPLHVFSTADDTVDTSTAPILIQTILDPLSKSSQQLSGVLSFTRDFLSTDISILLNPRQDYGDLPLKTFYRYVAPSPRLRATNNTVATDHGDQQPRSSLLAGNSSYPRPPRAVFPLLPLRHTLTLGMDVPEAWLVEPVTAKHDLDNLRMDQSQDQDINQYIQAHFELEALLVTGMCIDATAIKMKKGEAHPRGVQLQLGTASLPSVVDTLVMSNLGYYQLKASPGAWQLRLAPGRSRDLYNIAASSGSADDPTNNGGSSHAALFGSDGAAAMTPSMDGLTSRVAMTSFTGKHMLLLLKKHGDKLDEDVLLESEESNSDGSVAGMASSMWRKMKKGAQHDASLAVGQNEDNETIHVFTVASGHMYERLQKIMILSAIKRTKHKVKFWFIKNYMSPQMKDFVPYMAKAYGFDYEFVTYKWPSWLHKQTEKQRIIWAYKILFLDVLFPLNLKKVIFCDSDQVIRTDLHQLWTMDLEGAPYGYTPFCDNNKEMEGFRFWKTGFWRDHLRGKPYHISALYVVDLERFRQIAAGDKLRVLYDSLSKDPNSLSNLDQDLPNYAQELVPIFSLPQEWLWCETWCGESTRTQAKTIDLCNNPLTKEPKLQSARRIIKEWPDLNREAEEFTSLVDSVITGEKKEDILVKSGRFMTYLEPMVEGSVRTTGNDKILEEREDDVGGDSTSHDSSEL